MINKKRGEDWNKKREKGEIMRKEPKKNIESKLTHKKKHKIEIWLVYRFFILKISNETKI